MENNQIFLRLIVKRNFMKKLILLVLTLLVKLMPWAQTSPMPSPVNPIVVSDLDPLAKSLYDDVKMLSDTIGSRNAFYYSALNATIQYIQKRLANTSWELSLHTYTIPAEESETKSSDQQYHNIVFQKKGYGDSQDIIVIGAHYDSAYNPGADDNGSAVASLIALGHMLDTYKNYHTIRLVFFTLEEPPYFRSSYMGSRRYAQYMSEQKETMKLMVCLEMIGYYSDENIQEYPLPTMKLIYPSQGNFVTITSQMSSAKETNLFVQFVKKHNPFLVLPFITPDDLLYVHLSDHAEFWKFGYPALMVTDTSFYRNKNYHTAHDTYDTLDYTKLSQLTTAICLSVQDFDKDGVAENNK